MLLGGGKAQELGDTLQVGGILASAFLQYLTEFSPEGRIIVLAIFGHILKQPKDALRTAFADRAHVATFLQQLARDIQRQIGGIDHAPHKTQIRRQELVSIFHDKDALDVELDTTPRIAIPQVERSMTRDEKQLRVFAAALDTIVGPGQRILEIVRHVFVKLAILLVGNVGFIARPEGIGLVNRFPLAGLDLLGFILIPLLFKHFYRDRNVI